MAATPREVKIRQIAYELWEQDGQPEGRELEHYFRAEQLVDSRSSKSGASSKSKATGSAARKPAVSRTRSTSAKKLRAAS